MIYNFPYIGLVANSSLSYVDVEGCYWSRTAYSANGAYRLWFNSSGVSPASNYSRYDGLSIRCVATT